MTPNPSKSKYRAPEKNVHRQVAEYLRAAYPKILFRSDSGAGMRLTIGQAVQQKKQQNGMRWPDLMICAARYYGPLEDRCFYYGLFIELKKPGTRLTKKDGTWASDHIKKQADCLCELQERGYWAEFAVGFDEAKSIIDKYLK